MRMTGMITSDEMSQHSTNLPTCTITGNIEANRGNMHVEIGGSFKAQVSSYSPVKKQIV